MTRGSALVIGEALVDVVVDASGTETRVVGGSPANVALGLARLGASVELLTHIARDEDGEAVVRHLAESGVRIRPESFSAERTPVARAALRADGSADYEFSVTWALPDLGADADGFDLLHLGSYSSLVPETATAIDRALADARRAGLLVTFDPNVRPALIGDIGRAAARFEEIVRQADVVKLSEEDARWLALGDSPEEVARRLVERGPRLAVVTRGAAGAVLASRWATVSSSAVRASVVDTVGAGDSYMAALARSALLGDLDGLGERAVRAIGRRSAIAAAVTVTRRGADLPWSVDLVDRGRP